MSYGGVVARCAHGAGLFRCFRGFYLVERPTTNHSGGCSQMLVDGHQRPLGDIWCFFLRCTVFLFALQGFLCYFLVGLMVFIGFHRCLRLWLLAKINIFRLKKGVFIGFGVHQCISCSCNTFSIFSNRST